MSNEERVVERFGFAVGYISYHVRRWNDPTPKIPSHFNCKCAICFDTKAKEYYGRRREVEARKFGLPRPGGGWGGSGV